MTPSGERQGSSTFKKESGMKVRIKGFGAVRKYVEEKGEEVFEVDDSFSVRDIIKLLNINPDLVALVVVNDNRVSKDFHPRDGDEIFLLNMASGG